MIQGEISRCLCLWNRKWCSCGNCQEMPTESECISCQEMNVLGNQLQISLWAVSWSACSKLMLNELLSPASLSQLTWKGIVVDIVIIKVDLKGTVVYIIIYCYISIFFQVNQELQKPKWVIRWIFDWGRSKWLSAKGLETYLLLITDSH